MPTSIKTIEDLSLNAWPAHQYQLYDGWILRFSYFYTHRTNCVEQIGPSALPVPDKIDYCESIYRSLGTPPVFKITPLLPDTFEPLLISRGYTVEHVTRVMTMTLDGRVPETPDEAVNITSFIPPKWIESLLNLNGTTNTLQRTVVPSMYRAIPKETICASISGANGICATGLGILDRDYLGVYAIYVDPAYRHHGCATRICREILRIGKAKGALEAYLQVVDGNQIAEAIYAGLGFKRYYEYYFRVKRDASRRP